MDLVRLGRKVTLADLDFVEPCYTLRPLKQALMAQGLDVVAWQTHETLGLGEAGSTIKPEMRWVLRREGDIILDIGYGVEGAKTLHLIEGAWDNPDLKVNVVINIARPMTSTVTDIVEYVKELGPVHGLINNSHLGDETNLEIIQEGAKIVAQAAERLSIPVIATTVDQQFAESLGSQNELGQPFRYLNRMMPKAFW